MGRTILPLSALAALFSCATTSGLPRPAPIPISPQAPASCREAPSGRIALPADDGAHEDPIEWWYWTGHLKSATGRWFGFEEVFFRTHFTAFPAAMAHLAVTEPEKGFFRNGSAQGMTGVTAPKGGFDLRVGTVAAIGGGGHDRLRSDLNGVALDLDLVATKAPVPQHGDGYTAYPFGGYTYYYSRERMTASGWISTGGEQVPVTGTAWFDHQWGDMFKAAHLGWDWFAIQLDDSREIMLFVVRDPKGPVLVGGSISDADCKKTDIAPGGYQITPMGTWTSPHTRCSYPMGWRVKVADVTVDLKPVLEDQEVTESHPTYWEGAATVTGSATGRAYVELTGYCNKEGDLPVSKAAEGGKGSP
jgi:predicted secreted hydrolase